MFTKIERASLFIADITLTGSSSDGKKRFSNPNVNLETGYAAGRLGWDRIIRVMNEHFGKREEQPFDLKNRRFPINYTLAPRNAEPVEQYEKGKAEKLKRLVSDIASAIKDADADALRKVDDAFRSFDINCLKLLNMVKGADHFSEPKIATVEQMRVWDAIPRLLDFGLIFSDYDPSKELYAYHWTYLGREAIKRMNNGKAVRADLSQAPVAASFHSESLNRA